MQRIVVLLVDAESSTTRDRASSSYLPDHLTLQYPGRTCHRLNRSEKKNRPVNPGKEVGELSAPSGRKSTKPTYLQQEPPRTFGPLNTVHSEQEIFADE